MYFKVNFKHKLHSKSVCKQLKTKMFPEVPTIVWFLWQNRGQLRELLILHSVLVKKSSLH